MLKEQKERDRSHPGNTRRQYMHFNTNASAAILSKSSHRSDVAAYAKLRSTQLGAFNWGPKYKIIEEHI